jgi:CelD/BcsL family acetyltransferase involved in cellulose biosynthesis
VNIEFSEDGRDFVGRDWTALVQADPDATFFHTPGYLKLYWEEFGETPEHLLLAFAEDAGRQVGAVAFERLGTTLRFLGGTEVTDYMGPAGVKELRPAIARELIRALLGRNDWNSADFLGLPEDSAWLRGLADPASAEGLWAQMEEKDVAPYLELPATRDEWLAGLASKLRHEIRRKARKLESESGGYEVTFSTRDTLAADLNRFVALHRSSEGPKGKFMQPGMEIFFRRLGEAFLEGDVFRLAFIETGGEKIAGAIGFAFGDTFYLYNSAFDHEWKPLSPGMVLVGELIQRAIEERRNAFDFLKGGLEYKFRFGAQPRKLMRLQITRGE